MPGAVRHGDMSCGHGDWPPRANDESSQDVIINGLGAHRKGDHWPTHCDTTPICHDGRAAAGSPDILVNGRPLVRIGDPIDCGDTACQGSPDVLVN